MVIIIILDLFIYSNFKKREKYLIGFIVFFFFLNETNIIVAVVDEKTLMNRFSPSSHDSA